MSERERIKDLRNALGLTMEKFGEKLGVTKVAISNIENGKRNVTEQMRKAICREFDVDYFWLTEGFGEMFIDSDAMLLGKIDRIMSDETDVRRDLIKGLVNASDERILAIMQVIDMLTESKNNNEKD